MGEVREGAVTFKGNPVNLCGPELRTGDAAPEFTLQNQALEDVALADSAGKNRVLVVVPSLDTGVCAMETKRFNDEAANLPNAIVYVISADLPFAQKRWCGSEGVENVVTLSAHNAAGEKFGTDYGVLIESGPLSRICCRAIFVADSNGTLTHVEYVSEIAEHPDYDAAIAAAK